MTTAAEPDAATPAACPGIAKAREAAKRDTPLTHLQIGARIRVGEAFHFHLPRTLATVKRSTKALFDLVLDFNPTELSATPVIETAFGELSLIRAKRCLELDELAKRPNDERAQKLLRAAAELEQYLPFIYDAWEETRKEAWEAVVEAEFEANSRYYNYLMANLGVARAEKVRYTENKNGDVGKLRDAALRVHEVRLKARVGEMQRSPVTVEAVAGMLGTWAIMNSLARSGTMVDETASKAMAVADDSRKDLQDEIADGVSTYLQVLRTEAETFPVLLILDHSDTYEDDDEAENAALKAIKKAEAAISTLCKEGVNSPAVPESRVATPEDVCERIATSSAYSVWKLPFFMDRALLGLPPKRANAARRMRELAAKIEGSKGITKALAGGGVDIASMAAPLAGPIGLTLAVMWGVMDLAKEVHEYHQLGVLFSASLSPQELLREDQHDPPSPVGILLSLLSVKP